MITKKTFIAYFLAIIIGILTGVVTTSAQQGPSSSGNLTAANTNVVLSTVGLGGAGFQVTGTWSGTITFQGSIDCSTYVSLNVYPPSSTTAQTTATSNGVFQAAAAGLSCVRARMTSYTSGTAVVTIVASSASAKSLSGGGGGLSLAGCSDTQVLFDDAAALGCDSTFTYDKANGRFTLAYGIPGGKTGTRIGSGTSGSRSALIFSKSDGDDVKLVFTDYADIVSDDGFNVCAVTVCMDIESNAITFVKAAIKDTYTNGQYVWLNAGVSDNAYAGTFLVANLSGAFNTSSAINSITGLQIFLTPNAGAGVVVNDTKYLSIINGGRVSTGTDHNYGIYIQDLGSDANDFAFYYAGAATTSIGADGTITSGSFVATSAGVVTTNEITGTIATFTTSTTTARLVVSPSPGINVTEITMNSCGTTSPTAVGNDNAFKVTVGATGGTGCLITFGTAFANAPICVANNETTAALARARSVTSNVEIYGVFAAGDVIAVSCIGR